MNMRREKTLRSCTSIEPLESRMLLSASLKTEVAFVDSGGTAPYGGLMADAAGNLYGVTIQGPGAAGLGTVFEEPVGGGPVKTLASFNGFDGESPQCTLISDSAGNLFGTTSFGGVSGFNPGHNDGFGSVFEVPASGGTVQTLASFDGSDGGWPQSTLIANSSGDLVGTTIDGGIGYNGNELTGDGTVFETPATGGTVTTLAFFDGSNGTHPNGNLIADSAGNLYGTTSGGGAYGDGTVFELPVGGGSLQTLVSFNGNDGSSPATGLIADAAGNFYGTTSGGGAHGDGAVFELPVGGGSLKLLASFNGRDGKSPDGGLIADAAGNLFGTTWPGNGNGSVFEIDARGGPIKTLAAFAGKDGSGPDGPLLADSAGNLYGTTWYGGPGYRPPNVGGDGIIFELTRSKFVLLQASPPPLQTATAGATKEFALGSLAPSGVVTAPFSDVIRWGDGSPNSVVTLQSAGTIPAVDHTYARPGTFTVLQTIAEANGSSATTLTFKVKVGRATAARLALISIPASVGHDAPFTVQLALDNASGNALTTDSSNATVAIESGPSGGKLAGTLAVSDISGIFTFSALQLSKPGNYMLKITDRKRNAELSSPITVT